MIVQTSTTGSSVGDVVKGSLAQESKPGQVRAKSEGIPIVTPRASAGTLTDALTASVGFFAVADARPTRKRQGGRCRQKEASE